MKKESMLAKVLDNLLEHTDRETKVSLYSVFLKHISQDASNI